METGDRGFFDNRLTGKLRCRRPDKADPEDPGMGAAAYESKAENEPEPACPGVGE